MPVFKTVWIPIQHIPKQLSLAQVVGCLESAEQLVQGGQHLLCQLGRDGVLVAEHFKYARCEEAMMSILAFQSAGGPGASAAHYVVHHTMCSRSSTRRAAWRR
jgi:hypothetical protein